MENWIKVSERLPEEEATVYVYIYNSQQVKQCSYRFGQFSLLENRRVVDGVTHWIGCVIPEPPK